VSYITGPCGFNVYVETPLIEKLSGTVEARTQMGATVSRDVANCTGRD